MALVISSIALDAADPPRLAEFWTQALGYRIAETNDADVVSLVRADGRAGPDIDIIPVPESKTVKNRLHLDLRAAHGSTQDQEVERLLALGAVRTDVGQGTEVDWVVLADPEGNEFCVLSRSEAAPDPQAAR
ncbi:MULTISPECIES: VOC family protein [unclassified Arthrobacter]|uniref:VOC family protein n=1 Tax=unclassified Arthrobacter TaxID=235627 RepID=UPI00210776F8|nr:MULTISPECIES: VOC family protein [unclassified Arthrobacter]MCQ1946486.1 VOC family protein [Arthrobacter sp. zg-Y1116]MCQ1986426.1 VOC family protein [Arthrobacter sp. zg-Y844]